MKKKEKKLIEAIDASRKGKDAERELEATIRAVDFAHKNKVNVIIAPEAQGGPNALFFRDVYAKRYPGEIVPTAVFVNFNVVNSPEKMQEHFPRLVQELKKGKKDPNQHILALKAVEKIQKNPFLSKPLKKPMVGKRREHIGAFVLIFSVDESRKTVRVENYSHHDEAYSSR